ncbi:ankyrin repeat protein [Colletotrichum asianum]|uniref:Ankyrin repeat protein n=1 Tax=Colletotrichum asianum TaxID=702518 RepID=A0A8H3WKR6_9PEZI|nr:ankyrin repeat protein [Colletotrichum asianum]
MADHVAEHLLAIVHLSFLGISLESHKPSGAESSKDAYGDSTSDTAESEHDDSSSLSSFHSVQHYNLDLEDDDLHEDWEYLKMFDTMGEDESSALVQSKMNDILELSNQILRETGGIDDKDMLGDIETFSSEILALQRLQKTLTRIRHSFTNFSTLTTATGSSTPTVLLHGNRDNAHMLQRCIEALEDRKNTIKKQTMGRNHTWHVIKSTLLLSVVEEVQSQFAKVDKSTSTTTTSTDKSVVLRNKAIAKWLSPIDFTAKHVDNLKRRQEGTGQWFLDSKVFHSWIQKDRQTLLCHGVPGTGKTILFSTIIEYLQSRFRNDPTVGVSYLILSFHRQHEHNPRNILGNILQQMYSALPAAHTAIMEAYHNHNNGTSLMSISEIIQCLRYITSRLTRVYLLVDGLDEYHRDGGYHDTLLTAFLELHKIANIKFLATCVPTSEITHHFPSAMVIEIEAEEDLVHFVDSQMSKIYRFIAGSMRIGEELKSAVANAVHGKLLEKGITFDNAYEESMDRIKAQPPRSRLLAESVFSWLIYAKRPLRASELRHALAVERGTTGLDRENILNIHLIISNISGLHLAAYFGLEEAFTTIIESSGTEIDINIKDSLHFTPLSYAAMGGRDDFIAWLLSKGEVLANSERDSFGLTAINIAAILGHIAGVSQFIKIGTADLDSKDNWGQTPLANAALRGHVEIVRVLVETNRVDVNSQDELEQTPLSSAAEHGQVEVVNFLLENREVDPNAVDLYGKTPLHHALAESMEETVQYLLDSGKVDISLSVKGEDNRTPLESALMEFGEEDSTTKLLVDRMEAVGINTEAVIQLWKDDVKLYSYSSSDDTHET